jgi:hypothetical protein
MEHKSPELKLQCKHDPQTDYMVICDHITGAISIAVMEDGIIDDPHDLATVTLSIHDAERLVADLQVRIPRIKEANLTKLITGE